MLHKSFEIIESKADQQAGTFEALVSVFGNVDRGGDRVLPGAFTKTLERWRATGDPIPVILSHQWDNPMAHIGVADPHDVVETEKGLRVKATLDIADNEVARQVYKLLQRRSLKEFSFGYDVPKGGQKRAKDGANNLSDINLVEVGPTLKGMNDATELYAVKSALGVEPEGTVEQQRAQADQVAEQDRREREQQIIPQDVPPAEPEPQPEPEPEPEPEPVPDAAEQREKAERVAEQARREREQAIIPADVEPAEPEPGPDLQAELEQVKATIAELRETLHDLQEHQKQADVTGKDRDSGRSVDPLREQADSLALEFASGGLSLRKPPRTVSAPPPELLPLGELKQRMRDEMLRHLSEDQTA